MNNDEWLETSQGFIRLNAVTTIEFNPSLIWEQEIRISCSGQFKYLVGHEANELLEKLGIERRVPLESKPIKIEKMLEAELHKPKIKTSLFSKLTKRWEETQ